MVYGVEDGNGQIFEIVCFVGVDIVDVIFFYFGSVLDGGVGVIFDLDKIVQLIVVFVIGMVGGEQVYFVGFYDLFEDLDGD